MRCASNTWTPPLPPRALQVLLGAARFKHLDMAQYTHLNTDQELPFAPVQEKYVAERQAAWAAEHEG